MSPLGFKALFALDGSIHVTCSLRFTSGATPANLLVASMGAKLLPSTSLWAGIGGAWKRDLSCCRRTLYRLSYVDSAVFEISLFHHHRVSSRPAFFCVIIFRVQTIGREHGRKRIRTKTAITDVTNSWDAIPSYIDIRPTFLVNDVNCDDQQNGLLIN